MLHCHYARGLQYSKQSDRRLTGWRLLALSESNYLAWHTLQHTATHCNTLQHTATLQYTATHCNTLQHATKYCNTLQHTATHCNTLQHTATHYNTLQHTATHCNRAIGWMISQKFNNTPRRTTVVTVLLWHGVNRLVVRFSSGNAKVLPMGPRPAWGLSPSSFFHFWTSKCCFER